MTRLGVYFTSLPVTFPLRVVGISHARISKRNRFLQDTRFAPHMISSPQHKIYTRRLVLTTKILRFLTIPTTMNTLFSTSSHWHFTLPLRNEREKRKEKVQDTNYKNQCTQLGRTGTSFAAEISITVRLIFRLLNPLL